MARIGVQILGDSTSLERAFRRSEVAAAEFNGRMNRLGQATRGALSQSGSKTSFLFGSGSFIAAAAGTAAITKSVQAASDLNEQITKSQAVFGQSSAEIRSWSQTTAKSLGISQRAALEATGTFGNLFTTVNLLPQQSAEMSRSLVQLAADLASFNNANINDVLLAIRSGLVGEAEPLRRYGVLLSETRVQQQAMADTGKKNVKALTDQEKALARYEIILRDTKPAQGDFAKTSQGLANQTRILKAQLSDLAANMGGVFLPAVNETVKGLNLVLGSVNQLSIVDQLTQKISANAAGMENAIPTVEAYRSALAGIKGESDALVVALDRVLLRLGPASRRPDDLAGPRGPGAIAISNAAVEAAQEQQAIKEAKARRQRLQKQFDVLSKGLGLKLDKATLTGSVQAQLDVLHEMESAVLRAEGRLGKTFKLEEALVAIRQQIKDLEDQAASEALAKRQKEVAANERILALKKQQTEEARRQAQEAARAAKAQFDAARAGAQALFGTLFQVSEAAQRQQAILGGSRGTKTVALPGAGGGQDARGLLGDLRTQIKSFNTLQKEILELQRKGAPASLLAAARSGQISADQVHALAQANASTLNQIFKNVRLADKLVSRAAKAEINARDVVLKAQTVRIEGVANPLHAGAGKEGLTINGGLHLHGVQNVKQLEAALERQAKKRAGQRRGRTGGKR